MPAIRKKRLIDASKYLAKTPVEASAPCRIDMGGTLDIRTLHYPLRNFSPCTFNIALGLRTFVTLLPYKSGFVKISSKGFKSAVFSFDRLPLKHPMGLMCAVAAYFGIHGVHIDIASSSPPRSGLGGSSVAAVAVIAAISRLFQLNGFIEKPSRSEIAWIAYSIEESVAGVPCGLQDQLAAAFGGVNAWRWQPGITGPPYRRLRVLTKADCPDLQNHLLLAYCGLPHESRHINRQWTTDFISGKTRTEWKKIVDFTRSFVQSFSEKKFQRALSHMNREVSVRRKMTPHVFDKTGETLVESARAVKCGARFTGAGEGGCIWALGEKNNIIRLKKNWQDILRPIKDACLLKTAVDYKGVIVK